jgi:crossover junction endodeoxyribonuclease RuvC
MIVLGIDPGSNYTGWGVIEVENRKMRSLGAGRISVGQHEFGKRLVLIYDGITSIVKQYNPQVAAIETVFVHKNVQSALKLGHARGAALVAVEKLGLSPIEISPRLVKKTVCGHGGMDKKGVEKMVKYLLGVQEALSTDAADALAIAISASVLHGSKV